MPVDAKILAKVKKSLVLGKKHHVAMRAVTEREILALYKEAAGKVANLGVMLKLQKDFITPVALNATTRKIGRILERLANKATAIIEKHAISSVRAGMKDTTVSLEIFKKGIKRQYHPEILRAPFQRIQQSTIRAYLTPLDGIKLSDRIWDLHQTSLMKMKRAIATGYLEGKFPEQIGAEVRRFLHLPDVDMRKKIWKQFFREHPPGRGVYKSAHKNIERVLRTESNRAYRMGQAAYAKNRKWIKGVKWERVAAAVDCPECDEYASADLYGLGSGVYPPDAIPQSHPHCLCYLINVWRDDIFAPEGKAKIEKS